MANMVTMFGLLAVLYSGLSGVLSKGVVRTLVWILSIIFGVLALG